VAELEAAVKTPPGMRSNSQAAMQHKLTAATTLIDRLKGELARSAVPGLMDSRQPLKQKPTRSGMRIQESEGGDVSLRGLGGSVTAKRDAA